MGIHPPRQRQSRESAEPSRPEPLVREWQDEPVGICVRRGVALGGATDTNTDQRASGVGQRERRQGARSRNMRRWLAIGGLGAWLTTAIVGPLPAIVAQTMEPAPMSVLPPMFDATSHFPDAKPMAQSPAMASTDSIDHNFLPVGGAVRPAQDLYSRYAGAYRATEPNANAANCPPGQDPATAAGYGPVNPNGLWQYGNGGFGDVGYGKQPGAVEGIWSPARRWRLYYNQDVVRYRRTKPGDRLLVDTSPNLFDNLDLGTDSQLNADPNNDPLFLFFNNLDNSPPNLFTYNPPEPILEIFTNPVFRNPNDPELRNRFPTNAAGVELAPVPINEFILPGIERMSTDDFDYDQEYGFRHTLGIELANGDRIQFSYFWMKDFAAETLIDDVSGAAFATKIISSTGISGPVLQRMGYLRSPFTTRDFRFFGESRRELGELPGDTTSDQYAEELYPHYPFNEIPPLVQDIAGFPLDYEADQPGFFFGNEDDPISSSDIPREPTNDDPFILGTVDVTGVARGDDRYLRSLLFTDGEIAVANYAFDLQTGDLSYHRPFGQWFSNWVKLEFIGGIRYIAMDENFTFYFADTSGNGPIPGTNGVLPFSQFDRFQRNVQRGGVDDTFNLDPGLTPQDFVGTLIIRPQPAEETQMIITTTVDNNIVGPQVGLEASFPFLFICELDVMSKGGFMANFLRNRNIADRRDGLTLFDYEKDITSTSGVIEGRIGLTIRPHRSVSIHGGWEYLWMVNIATAVGNIEYDLDMRPRPSNRDEVLFHGWYGGFEFLF